MANLISVPLQNNTNLGIGPYDRIQDVLNIQPVIPVRLSENWNLITATAGEPKQLAQAKTENEGRFELRVTGAPDSSLYIVAFGGEPTVRGGGDNPAIGLLVVLGSKPPTHVVINEMTTVASIWTNAQFLDGARLKGPAVGLRIAAGNVPNFVNPSTGGWGEAIQSSLNGARRRPWRISPPSPTCSPLVSLG